MHIPASELNPWMICSVSLAARWFLPGVAWGWVFLREPDTARKSWQTWIMAAAACLVAGLTGSVFITWALAALGQYSVAAEWLSLAALTCAGAMAGHRIAPRAFREHAVRSLPGLLFFLLGAAVVMNLPRRGEWIMGGWDPGIYINQGAVIARHGALTPPSQACYRELEADELHLFTRRFNSAYIEIAAGLPLDTETRAFRPCFFPAASCAVAHAWRSGGLRAAARINTFIGLAIGIVFLALMLRAVPGAAHALCAAVALFVQPVLLYHLHTPLSEVLELFFFCAAGFLLLDPARGFVSRVALAMVCFVAVLNRISFVGPALFLLLLMGLLDARRTDRLRTAVEHALALAGVSAAMLFDLAQSAMIPRLQHVLPLLARLGIAAVAGLVVIDAAASWRPARSCFTGLKISAWLVMGLTAGCLAILAGIAGYFGVEMFEVWWATLASLYPFIGWPFLVLAAVGLVAMLAVPARRRAVAPELWILLGVLALMLNALLIQKWVAELYPWATRRFLSCTALPLAVLTGALPAMLWEARPRKHGLKLLGLTLMLILLAGTARRSWHAWQRTEYDGLSAILRNVANQIQPGDIVVTDHSRWVMPLICIYDKQVLDGSRLDGDLSSAAWRQAWRALERLGRSRRIRLLLSPADDRRFLSAPGVGATADWRSDRLEYQEIIHHPRAAGYEMRKRACAFELFTMVSPP